MAGLFGLFAFYGVCAHPSLASSRAEIRATAILGAPSYLSGFDRDLQSTLTRMYHEHHEPVKAKRLRAAQAGLELIENRGGLVHTQLAKAIGCIEVTQEGPNGRRIVTRRIFAKELKDKKLAAEAAFVLDA